MEGGSPAAIRERWTLPMLYAQRRYWADNPPVDALVRAYFKIKPKYTPPPPPASARAQDATPARAWDWSQLDDPSRLTGPHITQGR